MHFESGFSFQKHSLSIEVQLFKVGKLQNKMFKSNLNFTIPNERILQIKFWYYDQLGPVVNYCFLNNKCFLFQFKTSYLKVNNMFHKRKKQPLGMQTGLVFHGHKASEGFGTYGSEIVSFVKINNFRIFMKKNDSFICESLIIVLQS